MSELRPCIVRIPEKAEYKQKAEERKGYFHKWSDRFWTIGQSPMVGGYAAGQMSQTVGIVEHEDGTVREYYPWQIQFTDRELRKEGSRNLFEPLDSEFSEIENNRQNVCISARKYMLNGEENEGKL